MNGWYFHVQRINNGRHVRLHVHKLDNKKKPIGSITFERVDWEGFRPILIAGMRAAGLMRIPCEMQDQTRNEDGLIITH